MNNTAILHNLKIKPTESSDLIVINNPNYKSLGFSDKTLATLQKTLSVYSESKFEDDVWKIKYAAARKAKNLKIPSLNEFDGNLIRAFIIEKLSQAETSISVDISNAKFVFEYFASYNICVANCTTGLFEQFYVYLEKQGFTSALANARLTVLARLVQLCEMYELRPANMLIDCSRRFPQQNKYLKAPERDVIWRLDELFFDAENDISLPIRTMYLMLRLICNRISEVLAIEIDCLSYPEENIFCITIPTFKKTPFHVPEYYDYYRLKTGVIEGYLHDCLCQQIAFAKKCQSSIRDEAKGLLFVSSSGTSLVTNSMFNKFLSKLCNEYHIYDSTGHIAKVTSHALRHYGVTERNFFQLISQEMTRLECNHSNEWATIGYSYPASVDAAATSQKVLAMAFPTQVTEKTLKNETSEPQVFREYLYRTAEKQDTVRLIPGNGLCQCSGCIPRFAVCANCKSFIPDPQYKDILIKTSLRLKDKIERLQKNNADSEIIRFNQMQLDTLQILLSRIT